jgi:hypothetical protein
MISVDVHVGSTGKIGWFGRSKRVYIPTGRETSTEIPVVTLRSALADSDKCTEKSDHVMSAVMKFVININGLMEIRDEHS